VGGDVEPPTGVPRRDAIAYHEAGHAAVGHHYGLRVEHIYFGDLGGQVIFDDEWSDDAVLGDPDLLDRYVLMLLAGPCAEWRHTGTVEGATGDLAALTWLLRSARQHGTTPMSDRWRRTTTEVTRHWRGIAAVADELAHWSTSIEDPPALLVQQQHLGVGVREVTGDRARELLQHED
jgi:hypothetical protein